MFDDTIRSMDLKYLPYRGWRFIAYADGQLVLHLVGAHDQKYPLMNYRFIPPVVVETAVNDMVCMLGDSLAVMVCRACLGLVFPHEGGTLARVR